MRGRGDTPLSLQPPAAALQLISGTTTNTRGFAMTTPIGSYTINCLPTPLHLMRTHNLRMTNVEYTQHATFPRHAFTDAYALRVYLTVNQCHLLIVRFMDRPIVASPHLVDAVLALALATKMSDWLSVEDIDIPLCQCSLSLSQD